MDTPTEESEEPPFCRRSPGTHCDGEKCIEFPVFGEEEAVRSWEVLMVIVVQEVADVPADRVA